MQSANYINHIAFVIDSSSSMQYLAHQTVQVADLQVKHLANRSQEMDQETRATVYTFSDTIKCAFYDKDVLRLPSLGDSYRPGGLTALIDATLKAISDLEKTATLYGDHSFLIYVITDGQENRSVARASDLRRKIESLPENWTLAAMVPNQNGVFEAKGFGFPAQNIMVWDTTEQGMREVGETIRRTTDSYMTMRSSGIRGSRTLFEVNTDAINTNVLKSALNELPPHEYTVYPVWADGRIDETVEALTQKAYRTGSAYYELSKTELVQGNKQIMVLDNRNGKMYYGKNARQLLGIPDYDLKVRPGDYSDFKVFVQSTSLNRKLIGGTQVAVLG